ncbi:MAG: hypothetical protein FWD58_03185 [Firmicutes bacterium]|nr:hypothetical protein [Bacillota bacterium]
MNLQDYLKKKQDALKAQKPKKKEVVVDEFFKAMGFPQINFYDYDFVDEYGQRTGVVEVFVCCEFSKIKKNLFESFMIEDDNAPEKEWQVLYMEQYFSADRSKKLCDTYDTPENNAKNFFLVFFIYELSEGQVLQTPWGSVTVTNLQKLPDEYSGLLEFEPAD